MDTTNEPVPVPSIRAVKSALDGIPIDDSKFHFGRASPPNTPLIVTSCCPHCGNPIYSRESLQTDKETSPVVRTCCCAEIHVIQHNNSDKGLPTMDQSVESERGQ